MNYIFPLIWLLACAFSIDEMTMGFKGQHRDKRRINYKAEGDGFQADALCQDGFTYQVYMRNDRAPAKYLKNGLSPLHSRVMALFDSVKEDYHQCAMDNLYNSAAFCKASYNHPRKVLCHGVTRLGMRGIPPSVQQKEVKNRKEQISVRGTVKAAVLEGDDGCPNLIASSVYDAKPVHYLSMVSNELKWMVVKKDCYNVDSGEVEVLEFLRLKHIDKYNQEMGNVDLADQLRGTYRLDKSIRNRKWWWSIFFWSIGVMLTNAYVMYCKVQLENGIQKKDVLTHLKFREAIALYWINPEEYVDQKKSIIKTTLTRKSTSTSSMTSSITMDTSMTLNIKRGTKPGTKHVNDDSILTNGSLRCRLDRCLDHLPSEKLSSRARCGMHRWVGVESQSQVSYCYSCGVHLCIKCYRLFHHQADLLCKKVSLRRKYTK